MRVNKPLDVPAARTEPPASPSTPAPDKGQEPRETPAAQVALTITHAQRAASTARSARLREIESAVKLGTYRPDAGRIAEEILTSAELDARLRTMLIP